ncbi:MAG: hypothetical protein DYH13_06505 [Alphaproteobacteria bacterium PRO2]|nr:hypothetical protein [Alphaproteobacteria bacterium PRO2]
MSIFSNWFVKPAETYPVLKPESQIPPHPDTPLENYLIVIPVPPPAITSAFNFACRRTSELNYGVRNELVWAGTQIALCGNVPVIAPVSGKVFLSGFAADEWRAGKWPTVSASWPNWSRPNTEDGIPNGIILAKIQPIKGSNPDNYIINAYAPLFNASSIAFNNERRSWYKTYGKTRDEIEAKRHRFESALEVLKNAPLRRETLPSRDLG